MAEEVSETGHWYTDIVVVHHNEKEAGDVSKVIGTVGKARAMIKSCNRD